MLANLQARCRLVGGTADPVGQDVSMSHDTVAESAGLPSFAPGKTTAARSGLADFGGARTPGHAEEPPPVGTPHGSPQAGGASAAHLLSHWAEGDGGAAAEPPADAPHATLHGHEHEAAPEQHSAWNFDAAWAGLHGQADQESGPGAGAHSAGGSLPGVMGEMEHRFGHDFSDVHVSNELPAEARAQGAKGVAAGGHVALDAQVNVDSTEGKKILAHELAHVVQQRKGQNTPDALDDHVETAAANPAVMEQAAAQKQNRDQLEDEANSASDQVASGGQPHIRSGAQTPRNQFFGLGDLWDKAKSTAAGAWNGVKKTATGAVDAAKQGASWVGDKAKQGWDLAKKGASWAGDKAKQGASWIGDKAKQGASWVGDKAKQGWDLAKKGASWAGGKIKQGASWLGNKAKQGASWAGDKLKQGVNLAKQGASWLGDKAKQGFAAVSKKVGQVFGDLKRSVAQEGLLGLLTDPVGAMDRQRAQRELADRFQVVGPDYKGVRAPNTVTQAEYERIAHTYSDIRLGRGDLTIDPTGLATGKERDAYRDGALRDVAAMMQTGSGRREIEQLHNNATQDEKGNPRDVHRHTTMVPLFRQDAKGQFDPKLGLDRTNGYAAPDGAGAERQVNADGSLGTAGSGTNVHIRYNPGVNIGDAYSTLTPTNPWLGQMRSDVLLAHEMNHAVKQTAGMVDPRAVQATDNAANPADPDMANDAAFRDQHNNPLGRVEHQAVGLGLYGGDDMTENAYRRERRQLADQGGVGQITGDKQLIQRNTYVPRNPPPAPAPGPGPAPAPGPGPGIPEFMNDTDR